MPTRAAGPGQTVQTLTNAHGYYRAKLRATTTEPITVAVSDTPRYVGTRKVYNQPVESQPRCRLSRRHAKVNQQVVLRCHVKDLDDGVRYQVQEKVHGRWLRARTFTTIRSNGDTLYLRPAKRGTLIIREVFARTDVWARSTSNAVRLHVE
jgi:hypothetical protein